MSCAAYSTIEDAWGNKKFRRSKRSKHKNDSGFSNTIPLSRHISEPVPNMDDPICDLYDCNYSVDNTAISRASGSTRYAEDFQNSRDMNVQTSVPTNTLPSTQSNSVDLVSTNNELPRQVHYTSRDTYDVFLYIFSGITLLFLLEQFIQLGMFLGNRTTLPTSSLNGKST
jgi:hypothetical protein